MNYIQVAEVQTRIDDLWPNANWVKNAEELKLIEKYYRDLNFDWVMEAMDRVRAKWASDTPKLAWFHEKFDEVKKDQSCRVSPEEEAKEIEQRRRQEEYEIAESKRWAKSFLESLTPEDEKRLEEVRASGRWAPRKTNSQMYAAWAELVLKKELFHA